MNKFNTHFISVLGWPGIGKGYCITKYLANNTSNMNLIHISYGDTMRQYESINSEIRELRHQAIVNKDDTSFRKLETIFLIQILPHILERITSDTIVLLDNFPVHKDALTQFNKYNPQGILQFILFDTSDYDLLISRMVGRFRSDSYSREYAINRINTYKYVVLPNLADMSKLYNKREKEMLVKVDYYDAYDVFCSQMALINFILTDKSFLLHNNCENTYISVKDNKFDLMNCYINNCKKYNLPQAYINTITNQITTDYVIFSCKSGRTFYLLENPRYLSKNRYVLWPIFDITMFKSTEIDVHTWKSSIFPRTEQIPCNIVDLLLNMKSEDLIMWMNDIEELDYLSKRHLAAKLGVMENCISSFVHYPGASYYSVIHFHFTINFNHSYSRVHLLADVISDIRTIISNNTLRHKILLKYSSYSTSLEDIYSFYMSPLTGCVSNKIIRI